MDSYDRGAIRFHWASALGILLLWPLGKLMTPGAGPPSTALYTIHVIVGLTIALLTIARIVWVIRHERPSQLDMPKWEKLLLVANHVVLYGVLLVLSISGIGILLAAGSLDAIALAKSDGPNDQHGIASTVFLLMFVMHVAGVVYYQVKKGNTMRRMGVPIGD